MRPSLKSTLLVPFALVLLAVCGAAAGAAAPLRDPGLTVQPASPSLKYGESVGLRIHLAVPGATLVVSRAAAGNLTYAPLRTLVADGSGNASLTDAPEHSVLYRVEFAGDQTWAPAAAETAVAVKASLSLSTSAGAIVHTGDRVTIKVGVTPETTAAPLILQEWDASASSWRTLATLTRDAAGQARWVWRPKDLGRHRLRTVLEATATSPVSVSGVRSVRVYDAGDPYAVPASYPHLILVDLSKYRLHYYEHGRVIRIFDCVLGRPSLPTPRGHFKIYAKDPQMSGAYGPRRMRYQGLYAIHGTNEPWLLSRRPRNYSHGCTRLSNEHILWLFDRVHVGTPVWNVP